MALPGKWLVSRNCGENPKFEDRNMKQIRKTKKEIQNKKTNK